MTSKDIEDYGGVLQAGTWLRECALQLALVNEREEGREVEKKQIKSALNKKTHQLHHILDKAVTPVTNGTKLDGTPIQMTLADRLSWLVDRFIELDEVITALTADRDNLLGKLQEAGTAAQYRA